MKAKPDCYECLRGLAYQAANLADDDEKVRESAIKAALRTLDANFSTNEVTITVAAKIHEAIKEITGNPDPYSTMKDEELSIARELYPRVSPKYKDDLRGRLSLATAANAIDFFKRRSFIEEHISNPLEFAIDDSSRFEAKLKDAKKVLYLADNAGEIYFDLPLVKWVRRFANVIYIVKPRPVQDDATLEDIRKAGLEGDFGAIMTGTASPGLMLPLASEEFKRQFESADLILAKGMGNYESLSELPGQGKILYCLMAKCNPVAQSLGVPLNSYVALLD
jgi:damage-control phosphatase, subfamily I